MEVVVWVLLGFSAAWAWVALLDRLSGTYVVAQLGLESVSGIETSTAAFFVFYSVSIGLLMYVLFRPSLRQAVFRWPSPADVSHPETTPRGRLRFLLPGRPVEWPAILAMNVGLIGLRFLLFPFPQGADTPQYIEAANRILLQVDRETALPMGGIASGRTLTVWSITLLRAVLGGLSGNAEILTAMLVPLILGIGYSFALYAAIRLLTPDRSLAFWAAFLAPTCFLTIRLSYDLFAQFLGQAIMILALAAFLRHCVAATPRLWVVAALFAVGLLAHIWTWVIFTGLALAASVWIGLRSPRGLLRTARDSSVALGPSIAGMGLLLFSATQVRTALVYPFSVGDSRPLSFADTWFWIGGWESVFAWILGIVGLATLARGRSEPLLAVVLLLWTGLLSALIFVLGYTQSYRLILIYPTPVLIALGLREIRRECGRCRSATSAPRPSLDRVVAVAVAALLVATVLPQTFVPGWTFWPGPTAYEELDRIRDAYGFGNASVLILVDEARFEDAFLWTRAVTGSQTYPGNLLSLLRGDPYQLDQHQWIPPDLTGVREVLIPRTLYTPDAFERTLVASGPVPEVWVYATSLAFDPDAFTSDRARPLADDFWRFWNATQTDLEVQFEATSGGLLWQLPGQPATPEARCVVYSRPLPAGTHESLYLLTAGAPAGVPAELAVRYEDGNVTSGSLEALHTDPRLLRIPLAPGRIAERMDVRLCVDPWQPVSEGWLRIDFMALVGEATSDG